MMDSNSFSMLFAVPDETYKYSYTSSSSSFVDCTLSLATPSTRLINENERRVHHERRPSCMSKIFGKKNPSPTQTRKSGRSGNSISSSGSNSGGDPLLSRRCANCDTTSTPLWRNGPRGPKSLCNACGIRFKKEERRAAAASINGGGAAMEAENVINNSSWVHQYSQSQKIPYYYYPIHGNEFSFIQDDDRDKDDGIPFLSWRLNVAADRPSLVHNFTR